MRCHLYRNLKNRRSLKTTFFDLHHYGKRKPGRHKNMHTIPNNDTISISKTFHASIEKIWAAWTDPSIISKWFGSDPNGIVLNAMMDVMPGGHFAITFKDGNGTEHTCYGVYRDVQPYDKLSFSWMWRSEPGVSSFVTVLLMPQQDGTCMQFEHANVGNASALLGSEGVDGLLVGGASLEPESWSSICSA